MRRTQTDASPFLLAAILILLAGGIIFIYFSLRTDPIEEALSGDRVINTLFIFESQGKPLSSFVLMYYPATRRAAIFDIPRDLGLIIRRINRVDRIDALYDRQKIGGFENEIEGLLGIELNFSVILGEEDLGKAVDLLEGVEIFIPSPVEIYDSPPVLFPAGLVRLDGDKARGYVAYEFPEEGRDMASFRRQRFFLGFIKRLGEMREHIANPSVDSLFYSFLTTNMNRRTWQRLAGEFAFIDTDRTNIQSVGGNIREISGQTLLLPSWDGSLIKQIVGQTLGAITRQSEGSLSDRVFTVEVLNGTNINGLAGRTAELLRSFGYDVISIGNAERDDVEKTEIIDRSAFTEEVRTFGEILRCRNIRAESPLAENLETEPEVHNFEYRSDFILIIGRDFDGRYVVGG
ncbi:MAG: LCP family protein [Treponema sp.]|nr:LCP family protein [Treponema sp.]